MKKIKLQKLLLAVTLIFSMCFAGTQAAQDNMLFADPANEVYAKHLNRLGIYSFYGDGELFFEDSKAVKRVEAAISLASLMGYDTENAAGSVSHMFIDVPDYYEYAGVVDITVSLGLMQGMGAGIFAPEDNIKLEHFLKSIVIALGYNYKAQAQGGYPGGYIAVANELNLLKGVTAAYSDDMSREMLVRILYNALDVEICMPVSISENYTEYKKMKDTTVLTEYHNIYIEEDVVNSNNVLSLKSFFTPSDDKIIIGEEMIFVGEATDIFNYAGCEIEYYYRLIDDEKYLISFELTKHNNVYTFSRQDITGTETNKVIFENENGKEDKVSINTNANVFLNGNLVTKDVSEKIESFADTITLIDNDGDEVADVVFIEDYTYDIVDYVDAELERIYLEDSTVYYEDKKFISVQSASGSVTDLESLTEGTVVGIGTEADSDVLMIKVMGLPQSITVKATADDGIITLDGISYYLHKNLSDDMKKYLEIGKSAAVVVNDTNEIVWADSVSGAVKIGYLIKTLSGSEGLETEVALKILDLDGVITEYMIGEKLRINDTSIDKDNVAAYLKECKNKLNLAADGETAQVVYYMTDEEGNLTKVYTAGTTEDSKFLLRYNCNERGDAFLRDHGYGSAVFASAYGLLNTVPIFRIPLENIEGYDDKYFGVTKYNTTDFKDGASFKFDSYTTEKTDILPSVIVYYKTASSDVSKKADFFLIEKVSEVLDSDGLPTTQLEGWYQNAKKIYLVGSEVVLPELSAGDIGIFAVDTIDTITGFIKLYDYETDWVNPDFIGGMGESAVVKVLHVYNAPAGSEFMEVFEGGFGNGVPGDDKKILFNLKPYHSTKKNLFTFDIEKEEGKTNEPDKVIDYLHDSQNYAKIVVRYGNNYQGSAVFYQ